jgi:hypothetical protein
MGLIRLILIGTVPTAYAVNHAVSYQQSQDFVAVSIETAGVLDDYVSSSAVIGDPRDEVTDYIRRNISRRIPWAAQFGKWDRHRIFAVQRSQGCATR